MVFVNHPSEMSREFTCLLDFTLAHKVNFLAAINNDSALPIGGMAAT
jgi:hypothetical protein